MKLSWLCHEPVMLLSLTSHRLSWLCHALVMTKTRPVMTTNALVMLLSYSYHALIMLLSYSVMVDSNTVMHLSYSCHALVILLSYSCDSLVKTYHTLVMLCDLRYHHHVGDPKVVQEIIQKRILRLDRSMSSLYTSYKLAYRFSLYRI